MEPERCYRIYSVSQAIPRLELIPSLVVLPGIFTSLTRDSYKVGLE